MHITLKPDEVEYGETPCPFGFDINALEVLGLIEHTLEIPINDYGQSEPRNPADEVAKDIAYSFWDHEPWIVLYDVGQAYGGPEEGGWYYPVYEYQGAWRIHGNDWNTMAPQIRAALEMYSGYYESLNEGTYGSTAGWTEYRVEFELVQQGEHPGFLGHTPRPVYC